jgi:HK97 family phage prohead protease
MTTSNIERRIFDSGALEIRAAGEDTAPVIRGYAAKFNTKSSLMYDFYEQISPGAFDDVLADDVRALFNHDPNHILGRSNAGTLKIWQDETGLGYEVTLPDTQAARDLQVSIQRGDVNQSSFAFTIADGGQDWIDNGDGTYTRIIKKMKRLYDVSPVTYPAYPDATVGMRSLEAVKKQRDAESGEKDSQERAARKREADARARLLTLNSD